MSTFLVFLGLDRRNRVVVEMFGFLLEWVEMF